MAISDTLSDAAHDIRDLLHSQQSMYEFVRPRIDALLAEMDSIRALLDTPPHSEHTGQSVREALSAAVYMETVPASWHVTAHDTATVSGPARAIVSKDASRRG